MSTNKVVTLGRIVRLCLFAVFFAIGLHIGYEVEKTYIQQEIPLKYLAPYAVQNITHNGIEYAITDKGVVNRRLYTPEQKLLQLAYLATSTRVDPLLALPGVDLEEFKRAIGELEASQEGIAFMYSPDEAKVIRTTLYPISFLKSLHTLEQLRRHLIETPSFQVADAYQKEFTKTYKLYGESIERLQYALQEHMSNDINQSPIRLLSGYSIDLKIVIDTLTRYQNGVTEIYKKQHDRFYCYKGILEHCFEITRPYPPLVTQQTISKEYKNTVTQHQYFLEAFRKKQEPYSGYGHLYSTIELSKSKCGEKNKPGYYHLWWYENDSGVDVFRPDILHKIVLLNYYSKELGERLFEQVYRKLGGPQFVYQSIANHYACPDLGADMATLLSLLYISENKLRLAFVGNTPPTKIDSLISAVNITHDEINHHQQLSQATVEAYIRALHTLLLSTSEQDLYKYIGVTATKAINDLVTIYYAKTAYVPNMIMSVVSNNTIVVDYAVHNSAITLDFLLFLRSAPMTLLGGFTPTIQPQQHTFFYRYLHNQKSDFTTTLSNLKITDTTRFIRNLQKAMQIHSDMSSYQYHYPIHSPN